jgi:predicted porin
MDGELTSTSKAKLTSLPLLYIPKYTIGSNKLKGYLKGAFGIHYSRVKWEGTVLGVETWNIDISLGAGAGGTYELSQKVLLFVDYELLWLNNSNFSEVLSHTVGVGVGIML